MRNVKSVAHKSYLILGLLFLSATSFAAQQVEVFHLKRGAHFVYDHSERAHAWNFGSYSSRIDSGVVAYTIRDSLVLNDTTVVWSIHQRRDIVRKVRDFQIDTTYSVRDSILFNLYESTIGNHELRDTSLLWQFPFTINFTPLIRVFRYADSTGTYSFRGQVGGCMTIVPANFDSIMLSSDSSLIKRSFSFCDDHDEWGSYMWRRGTLRSFVVLGVDTDAPLPSRAFLYQNYPNPFNPSTTITYVLGHRSSVSLKVFDVLGREVATLVDEVQGAARPNDEGGRGFKSVTFDASRLVSGVYFYRLKAGSFVETRKLLLIR